MDVVEHFIALLLQQAENTAEIPVYVYVMLA